MGKMRRFLSCFILLFGCIFANDAFGVTCSFGQYLPASSSSCQTCPKGFYCPGGSFSTSSADQGKTSCPEGYTTTSTGMGSVSSCKITCSAGQRVVNPGEKCTTPAGGWYNSISQNIFYGETTEVVYCMSGYTNNGTKTSDHDDMSDCKISTPGQYVNSSNFGTRLIKVAIDPSENDYDLSIAEIQAFESNDASGTNLLSGASIYNESDVSNTDIATDGSFQGYYGTTSSTGEIIWALKSKKSVGSIILALPTMGQYYNNLKVYVSTGSLDSWTEVASFDYIKGLNSSTARGEKIILSGLPIECSSGTYKSSTSTVSLGETSTCDSCPIGTYNGDTGATSCTSCPDGYTTTSTGMMSEFTCKITCSAGQQVVNPGEKCTTPAGGWYTTQSTTIDYGKTSFVNYCSTGYTNNSTSPSEHDSMSDCKITVPAGHSLDKWPSASYLRVSISNASSSNSLDILEIQAFSENNDTGSNLLSGISATGATRYPGAATDGDTDPRKMTWTSSETGVLQWDDIPGGVSGIGMVKVMLYPSVGRSYQDFKIEISADGNDWTTIFEADKTIVPQNTSTPVYDIVLAVGGNQIKSCPSAQYQSKTQTIAISDTGYGIDCSNVSYGYYATGCDDSDESCTDQEICPIGSYCENGFKTSCPEGYTTTSTGMGNISSCKITCSAGQQVVNPGEKCTTPAGGWYTTQSTTIDYGKTSFVNYCSTGYTNNSTSPSEHDSMSDCKITVPAGHSLDKWPSASYLRVSISNASSSNSLDILEIQAFSENNDTGSNLLSGISATGATRYPGAATDGDTDPRKMTWTSSDTGVLQWDDIPGGVSGIGMVKVMLYPSVGRSYQDFKIEISADGNDWTTIFEADKTIVPQNTSTPVYDIVLAVGKEEQQCSAGTYSNSTSVVLGGSSSCDKCPLGQYNDKVGSASCTACPEGYNLTESTGSTDVKKCQMQVPAGQYVATENGPAVQCLAGYECAGGLMNYGSIGTITQCTGATYSEEGASSCTACPGNYTANTDNGKDNINKCEISVPENYYIASAGDDEPTVCPAGYTTNEPENVSYNSVSECDPDPYTINLDKNGGTGTTDETQICYHEQSCALPEVELTKPYFTFTGWGTTPDCVSGSYEMTFTSAQTIYACWSQNTIECQIGKYYDGKAFVNCPSGKYCPGTGYANEGTPGCASSCPVAPNGETVKSPSDASEFADCYFACDLDVEHASSVTPIQELVYAISNSEYESCTFNIVCDTGYNVNNNATENPSCTPKQYTITLDKNGGTGSVQSTINCTFDSKICELPDAMSLTKPGYSIGAQWCSGTNGEAPCYTGGTNITENISADATDITLYATWNPNVYEISLDDADATVAGSPATIYLKYSTGWFTDSSAKQAITKLSILPKKTGYEFAGYYSTQSGGTQIINSDGVLQTTPAALQISTSPTTIYARWSAGLTTCQPGTYYTGTGSDCTECPAGSYCTGGKYPTDSGIQEGIESCAALESGDWEYSESGASAASQCYKQCESYDVIYGTAIPLEEKAFYSNDCEFKGVSETGNPCDIIDSKCVETSCNSDYEMKDGLCVACNREFAMTYKPDGNCRVASCVAGYHPRDKQCELDIKECELPNALYSEQTWDFNTNAFGVCTPIECEDGYHIASNACISDSQQCNVENGIGVKEWNHTTQKWDKCIAVSCNPGYSNDPSETNERDKQCGECKNKYAVKGELAVSSYVQGCEIAACMYQGERYNLENNECVPICPTEEYEDETGTMVWDAISKKCVRTCKEGYTMW